MGYNELVEACLIDLIEANPIQGRHVLGNIVEDDYKNAEKWAWAKDFIQHDTLEARRRSLEEEIQQHPWNDIAKKALDLFNRQAG
jgi:hypothetical protein